MSGTELARLFNGEAVPRAELPRLALEDFRRAVVAAPREGGRVAALFAAPGEGGTELVAVLALDAEGTLRAGTTLVRGEGYPSLTPDCPEVHLFERAIAERWGLCPEGHPWLKPVRFPRGGVGVMDYYRVQGDEVHEVAVGPVHAGVIEPGHFRFQCHGETVLHLEVSLGYQHRGIARALRGGPGPRSVHLVETLAGDSTVAHATAYCAVLEALAGVEVPARAQSVRAIALELERLANHTGCLGALAGDVGFLPPAAYCGRLRGEWLNLTAQLCGSRFGRGLVRPGGVDFDLDAARARELVVRLDDAARALGEAVELLWTTASVQARFEDTGRVPEASARALGLVGVAARASGIERDVRHDLPAGAWQLAQVPVAVWGSGDVFARAMVRGLEAHRSADFVRERCRALPAGPGRVPVGPPRGGYFAAALVEGFRGEVCHVAWTGAGGRFAGYEVVDPSFHNWQGLALAMRGEAIADFPLCNKSFDLSYCGHDL